MGGQAESTMPAKVEGGQIGELRFHKSGAEIHFHDDKNKKKCAIPAAVWLKAWQELQVRPSTINFVDPVNETELMLTVRVRRKREEYDVEASLTPITFSKEFKALHEFTRI